MDFIKDIIQKIDEKFLSKLHKKQKIYLLIFVIIAVVLFWAFITAGVITHNFNRGMVNGEGDKQELEVKSMILTESKEGQKSWEIYGETGEYSSDHKIAILNNVIGNFYKDNKVTMSFQASHGTYNEETKNIDLKENTYVVLENDIAIIADTVTYYSESKVIIARGNVNINRQGTFLALADEAVVDSDFNLFKIKGCTETRIFESDSNNSKAPKTLF